jgi:hypothetical protein
MTLRLSLTFDLIKKESAAASAGAAPRPGGSSAGTKYHLTFSIYAINPLNHPDFSAPNGNLSSPFFGKPLSLQNNFTPGSATYNRKVTLQVQMSF